MAKSTDCHLEQWFLKFIDYNLISLKYLLFSRIHFIYTRESFALTALWTCERASPSIKQKLTHIELSLNLLIELKDDLVYIVRRLFSQEICVRLQSNEENAERPDNSSDLQKLESLCEDLHSCVQKLVRSVHNKLGSSFNDSKKKKCLIVDY